MINYTGPITQFFADNMRMEYENGVLRAVQQCGFHVDKEELAKALIYDRGQYEKGYSDASADLDLLINEFCVPTESDFVCEELSAWGIDEDGESYCGRNCRYACPSAECYKEWLRMKKGN